MVHTLTSWRLNVENRNRKTMWRCRLLPSAFCFLLRMAPLQPSTMMVMTATSQMHPCDDDNDDNGDMRMMTIDCFAAHVLLLNVWWPASVKQKQLTLQFSNLWNKTKMKQNKNETVPTPLRIMGYTRNCNDKFKSARPQAICWKKQTDCAGSMWDWIRIK